MEIHDLDGRHAEMLQQMRLNDVVSAAKLLKSTWNEGASAQAYAHRLLIAAMVNAKLLPPSVTITANF
jgi:hypothetical protein